MRFLRVIGTLLVVSSSANAIFWLFDTLLPIHRVTQLQPIPAQTLVNVPVGRSVLIECHRSETSSPVSNSSEVVTVANVGMLLECVGKPVRVETGATAMQYLSMLSPAGEQASANAIERGDPVVAVGQLKQNKGDMVVSADLVAYGNRMTYLGDLREKSMAQVLWSYALGGMGIAALLIDWQLAQRQRRVQQFAKQPVRPYFERSSLEKPGLDQASLENSKLPR